MVLSFFSLVGFPSGNQSDDFAAWSVCDDVKPTFNFADNETLALAILTPLVLIVQPVEIQKHSRSVFEGHTMFG
jgi:hypothetical protein